MNRPEENEFQSLPPRTFSGRFIDDQQAEIMQAFAARFNETFEGSSDTEIASLLDTARATIYPYRKGTRLPTAEILIKIGMVKRVNIDWLLTGRGAKVATKAEDIFTPEEEQEIRKLAKRARRTFEQQVRELALAAMEVGKKI